MELDRITEEERFIFSEFRNQYYATQFEKIRDKQ